MRNYVQTSEVVFKSGKGGQALVTVIVTLYNYASFVVDALDSVYASTLDEVSLVVVNDRSSDDSLEVAKNWMRHHKGRFCDCILLNNVENYGLATSRNFALDHVDTEFFFVLDADNSIYPRALEKLYRSCVNSGASAAYSQLEVFGDEKDVGYAYLWDRALFLDENYVDAMALIRKDHCDAVGRYSLFEIPGWEDYDLWCKFIENDFDAVFVPQMLCRYRVHGVSMLRSETNKSGSSVAAEMIARHPWLRLANYGS